MIEVNGMITVAEAAKRLNRSTEQVRRKLREGKIKGQRIGNQWFVEEANLSALQPDSALAPLVSRELMARIDRTRQAIYRRNRGTVDVQALLDDVRANGI